MPTKRKEYQRFAVLQKETGKVLKLKHMRHGYQPTLDPERYIAVKVGDDVEAGMIRNGEGFAWPK
jgi:hypothetical protein